MHVKALIILLPLLLAGCLELTPNVSTEFSEIEARAAFEGEIRSLCDHKKSRIPRILAEIDAAATEPTMDYWRFSVSEMEAQVFPSGLVTGDYIRHVQTELCR